MLTDLASTLWLDQTQPGDDEVAANLRARLDSLDRQTTTIVRQLADTGALHADALGSALAEIEDERTSIEKALRERSTKARNKSDVAKAIEQLDLVPIVDHAIADMDPDTLGKLFDVLSVDLMRVSGSRFEGKASIPLPAEIDRHTGEVYEEGLQRPVPNLPKREGLRFTVEVAA